MDFDTQTTLFTNGRILTMATDDPEYVEALVIQYGRIAFAGGVAQALAEYPEATIHDLEGFALMPGLGAADGLQGARPLLEQGASVYAALRALTVEAARASGADEVRGSLEVAKVADLVLLSADPMAVAPELVPDIAVVARIQLVRATPDVDEQA